MLFSSTFFFAALPLAALAGNRHQTSLRSRHRSSAHHHLHSRASSNYSLTDLYQGQTFFDEWDFFTSADPTDGLVDFISADEGCSSGLAYVDSNGTVVMAVDDVTQLAAGANRKSVRITSQKSYNEGLFIADIQYMPIGCSVWPAWWMVGPNWPSGGEIDILEGVNNQLYNQYTVHTSSGCTLNAATGSSSNSSAFTANVLGTTCESSNGANNGCGFRDVNTNSYGTGFNAVGGGVFATLWDDTGISIWHFTRSNIPADISSGNPNPSGWGTPAAFWSLASNVCSSSHFHDMSLVFDITLCGQWAGAAGAFPGNTNCTGTCAQAVQDPSNFVDAKWNINYVAVYT